MIRIDIDQQVSTDREVRGKEGRIMRFREQEAFAWLVGDDGQAKKYPTRILVNLEQDQVAYAPGSYTIKATSLYVDRFGKLAIGRLALQRLEASKNRAA